MNQQERLRLKRKVERIWARADAEGRSTTPRENRAIEHILNVLEGKTSPGVMLDNGGGWERGVGGGNFGVDPGQVFIKSDGFCTSLLPTARTASSCRTTWSSPAPSCRCASRPACTCGRGCRPT